MLEAILFKDKRFDTKNDNNLFTPSTKNTIILCNNLKLMTSLAEEILNTVNEKAEYNDYSCDLEDIGKAKYILNFGLQKVIQINEQRITLCLEPAMIYKATSIDDIWFFDWSGKDEAYKEAIYPMTIFKGSHDVWDKGLDEVYKMIVGGRYGGYDGCWTKLKYDETRGNGVYEKGNND